MVTSLCLTDAAVRRRKSPENVGDHQAVRREDLVLSQPAAMLNIEQSTWGSWRRLGQPRRNKRFFLWIKKEIGKYIFLVYLDRRTERWAHLSRRTKSDPNCSLSDCGLVSCCFNVHEYSCYLLLWIVPYYFAAFKREFILPTVVHY